MNNFKKPLRPQITDFPAENPQYSVRSRFKQLASHYKSANGTQSTGNYENEQYLSDLLKVLKIKSLVVGVGGAGNSTVSRLQELGIDKTKTMNINTDAHDLYYSNADKKILIGKDRCSGLGSGNDPEIGLDAAEEDVSRLSNSLNADIIFLTCGLGGGTGTGAAPIVAREAKKNGSLVVTFCTIPFRSEGPQKRLRAKSGVRELARYSDTMIPIPNDNLLKVVPNAPLLTCFKIMDEVLVRSISEINGIINRCGLVNIDFADVKKIFQKSSDLPSGLIGITESMGSDKDLIQKAKMALHNPLLEPDTSEVNSCLVNVSGDHQLTLAKTDKIISSISEDIPDNAVLKFGTVLDPTLRSKVRISVLGKGPVSPYVRAAVYSDK